MESINWAVVSILIGFAAAWSAVTLWAVKALQSSGREYMTQLFNELKKNIAHQDLQVQKVDRDLMNLRAELPKQYVMREDWIRFNGVIDARLETVNEKLNRLLERGVNHRE